MDGAMLQALAQAIDEALNPNKAKDERTIGFCLLVFGFNAPGISNYVSNAERADMIKALEETAMRLKNREDNVRYRHPNDPE